MRIYTIVQYNVFADLFFIVHRLPFSALSPALCDQKIWRF